MVSCSPEEEDFLSEKRARYTVEDLVKVASKYGVHFYPDANALDMPLSKEDVDSFEVSVQNMSALKGTYPLKNTSTNTIKMLQKNILETRSDTVDSMDGWYEFPTKFDGIYTCDCTIYWAVLFDEYYDVKNYTAMVNASVRDCFGNVRTSSLASNSVYEDNVHYNYYMNTIDFSGSIEWPFQKNTQMLGHFYIIYSGSVEVSYAGEGTIKWEF